MPSNTLDLEFLLNLDNEDQLYNEISNQFNEIASGFYATANLELLKHLRLKEDSRVLDLACGTGHLAIEIAQRIKKGKVVGVDLSPQMISKGKADAKKSKVKNINFIERNIHELLPDFKLGDFDIGISCFALSYLGSDFLLKEFYSLLGKKGQIGITTSSINSLTEWQAIFPDLVSAYSSEKKIFENMPANAEDLQERMGKVGFENVQVVSQKIPLIFQNSREAASFLISAGWLSSYFFSLEKEVRAQLVQWGLSKVDEYYQGKPLSTSVEFLIGWNEPSK